MKTVKIKIDKDLLDQCKTYSMASGYSSVEEFITHVLEKELRKNQNHHMDEDIEKQLKGLGYIE
jgi:metal-responsive CopG/Arc/MetJ family transcriptional regulator